ncbi:hypothetical protein JoomaDRAFT_2695 [Galbibacter orientalis DSM 19592]|uniref:Uncharacterized protein n=1 Tax=Galbibacter orientalis DSM 19592 TaxID=926559 RepID=I3C7S3_9FLAO|nr:hypothetical protein [Galbibacter orientalis]EIJ39666.1 hypothetical protein JoomaDRAFT_2695 [Galbibacter orientalis DSM 19592]
MKKTILSFALITIIFVAFAFAPAETNNSLTDDFEITDTVIEAQATCSTKYRTQESFSECNNTHTGEVLKQFEAMSNILGKY